MSDETKLGEAVRAAIVDAIGEAIGGLQRHLDEQLLEMQADVDTLLERFDGVEIDLREIKTHVAKLSREQIKDHRRDEAVSKRLADIERRLGALEKRE